ncbi:MAG: hypothetical protein U9R68_00990 [Planctomycetota bacterium]|nr:hypothetical protein [Planctomycetota bacterium]
MADKDVNIHIRAKQTGETNRKLRETARQTDRLGRGVEDAGRKAKKSGGLFAGLGRKLMGLAAGVVGIQQITRAIQAQTRALEENAEAAAKQQNALLRLQFLGDFFQEKPELRKEVGALAEFGRRPFEEVAGAWYNLRSKNAALSSEGRMGILREALEMGRTDPEMPLDQLVDMFSLYAKQSGETDANRIQNVLQQTITEAGGSGADVAAYMPRFLPIGISGGLSPSQAAGLWAYGTTQESEASVATTGLRAIMMGLQGKGTPQGAKLLQQYGVTQNMGFFEKLKALSAADIDLATAETLFQREGAAMGLAMLRDPDALMRTIGSVTGADTGAVDLTRAKIEGLMGTDEVAKMEEDLRLLDVNLQNVRASDTEAMRNMQALKEREIMWRKAGVPEYLIKTNLAGAKMMMGFGLSPEVAFSSPLEHWMLEQEGLPTDVGGYTESIQSAPGTTIINNDYSKTIQTKESPPTTRPGDL